MFHPILLKYEFQTLSLQNTSYDPHFPCKADEKEESESEEESSTDEDANEGRNLGSTSDVLNMVSYLPLIM